MRTRWQLALVCAALPLLAAAQDDEPSYIVPPDAPPPASIFTTHQNPNTSTLPWKKTEPPAAAPPPAAPSTYKPNDTVPFGHASSSVSQPIPAGPRMMQAVPVPGVDAIEVTTPAAPQPETPQVNPAAENPAVPTGATSPIFPDRPVLPPRKIIVRVLNKVTGRAETLEGKAGRGDPVRRARYPDGDVRGLDPRIAARLRRAARYPRARAGPDEGRRQAAVPRLDVCEQPRR